MRSRRLLAPAPYSLAEGLVTVSQDSVCLFAPLSQRPIELPLVFHVEIYAPPHRTIVRAHGEIDMVTGGTFRAAMIAALDLQPPMLVIDLDGVSFLDAWGLGLLVGVANRAGQDGVPIMVISARPNIYRLFDLTHLVDRLDVHARTTALGLATPGPAVAATAARRPPVPTPDWPRGTDDHDDLPGRPTRVLPGTWPRPEQGVAMTTIEPPPDRRPPATDATRPTGRRHVPPSARASRTWTAVILFAVPLILLLVLILQNKQRANVPLLGFHGDLPIAVALLFAAVTGALLIAISGTGRMHQLRQVACVLKKARQDPADTARPGSGNAQVRQPRPWPYRRRS